MDSFPIIVTSNDTETPEALGTKEKFWIKHNGVLHLLKFGREGTGENWAEKIASELCDLLKMPHAQYEFATYHGRNCILSRSIIDADARLILGNELINRTSRDHSFTRTYLQKGHTVSRVFAALATFTRPNHFATWDQFVGYLMFDAWIGNTDRHHENWGLILDGQRRLTLAPSFDHASSLGRELTDDVRLQRLQTKDSRFSVAAFAGKARSALFAEEDDKHPLSTFDAFTLAAKLRRGAAEQWLSRLDVITEPEIRTVFERVPNSFITEPSKLFALEILAVNKSRLLSMEVPSK